MIKIAGFVLMAVAFVSYGRLVQNIFQLVSDSRRINSGVRFNRFWWPPAWRVHRDGYPTSPVRRHIVWGFLLTCALMFAGMTCLAVSILHTRGFQ